MPTSKMGILIRCAPDEARALIRTAIKESFIPGTVPAKLDYAAAAVKLGASEHGLRRWVVRLKMQAWIEAQRERRTRVAKGYRTAHNYPATRKLRNPPTTPPAIEYPVTPPEPKKDDDSTK